MGPVRNKRKPRSPWRQQEPLLKHWLGEGVDGQESLLLDLDPYLYAVDGAISRTAASIAHNYDGDERKPLAVLVPEPGTVGWQIGYLSTKFDLCISSDGVDEILGEASESFNVSVFSGELPSVLEQSVDLFLHTHNRWQGEQDFACGVRQTQEYLSEQGSMGFVLRCSGFAEEGLNVQWMDGSTARLAMISEGRLFGLRPADMVTLIRLQDINPFEGKGLTAFLKRNRSFFGRNARELCLERMRDADFKRFFQSDAASSHWAAMLVYQ